MINAINNSGAIPLVVGEPDEISQLFHFNGDVMPLLTADSWDDMLDICQNMTDDEVSWDICLLACYYMYSPSKFLNSRFYIMRVRQNIVYVNPWTHKQMDRLKANEKKWRNGT